MRRARDPLSEGFVLRGDEPALHPGQYLLDHLKEAGWTQLELSERTGLHKKTINEICKGKASITAATAILFEKEFHRSAFYWLSLQASYDIAIARGRGRH